MFYRNHPHIFFFLELDALKLTYIKMRSQQVNAVDDKELFIEEQMVKFESEELTTYEFVKNVSRKFLPPKSL